MISRENSRQMRLARHPQPSRVARAVRERDAAIVRLRRARVAAIGGAGVLSLAFAALAQALAPGRRVNSRSSTQPPAKVSGATRSTGDDVAAPPSSAAPNAPAEPPSAPQSGSSPPVQSAPPVIVGGS
jgi:hypothetical protein